MDQITSSLARLSNDEKKLSRTISCYEIPKSQKIVLEQQSYDLESKNGLYRRLSYECNTDTYNTPRYTKFKRTGYEKYVDNLKNGTATPATLAEPWFTNIDFTFEKPLEKAYSCNDMRVKNNLENSFTKLNLKSQKKCTLALPPPTPSPSSSPKKNEINNEPQPSTSYSFDKNITQRTLKSCINDRSTNLNSNLYSPVTLNRKTNFSVKPHSILNYLWKILTILLLLAFVSLFSTTLKKDELVFFCVPTMNLSVMTFELQKRVYGQNEAINELTTHLQSRTTGFEIIALVGGTGVGKTHTANIMKQMLEDDYTIIEHVSPLNNKDTSTYKKLTACKCNLILIDNVQSTNLEEVTEYCKNLEKFAKNYCVLVMVLINMQEINNQMDKFVDAKHSFQLVRETFKNQYLNAKVVSYCSLEVEFLDYCILEAADHYNLTLSSKNLHEIRKQLLELQSGCKGAYAKVKVLGEIKNIPDLNRQT